MKYFTSGFWKMTGGFFIIIIVGILILGLVGWVSGETAVDPSVIGAESSDTSL